MSNYYPNHRCHRPTPPTQPTTFICRITGPIPTNGGPGGGPEAAFGVADVANGGPGRRPVTFLCRIFGPVSGGPGGPGGGPGGPGGPRFEEEEEFTMGQFPGAVLEFGGPGPEEFHGGRPGPRLPVPGLYTLQVLAPVTETNGPGGGPGGPGGGPGGPGGIGGGPGRRPCRPWCGPGGGPGGSGGGPGGPGGDPGGPGGIGGIGGGPGGPGKRPGTSPVSCNYCFFNDVEL